MSLFPFVHIVEYQKVGRWRHAGIQWDKMSENTYVKQQHLFQVHPRVFAHFFTMSFNQCNCLFLHSLVLQLCFNYVFIKRLKIKRKKGKQLRKESTRETVEKLFGRVGYIMQNKGIYFNNKTADTYSAVGNCWIQWRDKLFFNFFLVFKKN